MNHALPSDDPECQRLNEREVLGLRDAADRMERLEAALLLFLEPVSDVGPSEKFVRIDATIEDIAQARAALA